MGIKDIFGGKRKGVDCNDNEDGTKTCVRYELDKSNKITTGSQVTIAVDPNTCKAYPVGNLSINDEETQDFDQVAAQMEQQCRKGVASRSGQ